MPLCKDCENFDLQSFQTRPDRCLSLTFTSVEVNAKAGCGFCAFLLANADEYLNKMKSVQKRYAVWGGPWIRLSLTGEYDSASNKLSGCYRLHIYASNCKLPTVGEKVNDPAAASHEFCVAADQGSPAYQSKVISGRYLGQDRTSPGYVAAIREWLDNCINNHDLRCTTTVSGGTQIDPYDVPLPTRCIDVASRKGICLCECSHMRGGYITLSHRWTEAVDRCKTTRDNYEARTRGSGFYNLSHNFQDAILLAQKLDIRYVWIDSLCIIQGEKEDLNQELVKMAQYYQQSVFTIAAESKDIQSHGFLHLSSERPFDKLIRLPYREAGKQRGHFYVYKRKWRSDFQYLSEVDQSELLSRGWVCQEWFLSRRIIHFAPTDTYLECQSRKPCSISNDVVHEIPDRAHLERYEDAEDRGNIPFRLGFKTEFGVSNCEITSELGGWYDLIQAYSQLNLTNLEDHLIAVAGIAREFAWVISSVFPDKRNPSSNDLDSHSQSEYASGLWLPDIHYGLLWQGLTEKPRDCPCGAPSWSWLAFAGPVSWPLRHDQVVKECEILSVQREEHGDANVYLITMTPILTIRGRFQPVLVRGRMPSDVNKDIAIMTGDKLHATRKNGSYRTQGRHLICPVSSPETAGGWGTFERPDLLKTTGAERGYLTLALRVATRKKVAHRYQYGPNICRFGHDVVDVLFLEPVEEGEGRFRRVGVGSLFEREILYQFQQVKDMEVFLI